MTCPYVNEAKSTCSVVAERDAGDIFIAALREALRKALIWTDEESDAGEWRDEAEALLPFWQTSGKGDKP